MKKPKSILIFIQNGLGGAERVQIEIARMLLKDSWKIRFCMVDFSNNPNIIEKHYPKGVESVEILSTSQFGIIKGIYKKIREYKPQVVFASAMHINQRILFVSPLFQNIKFIMRNENYLSTLPRWKQLSLCIFYKFASVIISQSKDMERELINFKFNKYKIQTLHNPLDIHEIECKASAPSPFEDNSHTRYVAVGRVVKQKGFDTLLKAFVLVVGNSPNSELHILGDTSHEGGEVYNNLLKLVSEYKLEHKVFFHGFKDNPYPYIKNCDVFVLSSRFEGLPNALIEANLLEKPCAATTCIPIIKDIIHNGDNGFLASVDNISELASAMIRASKLKDIKIYYKPSEEKDFLTVFNSQLD